MRSRRGFSMLEVMVMGAIGLALISVAWFVFTGLTRQSKKLDTRLRAIQASQLTIERLKQDIKQYVHREDWSMVDSAPPRLSLPVFREYVFDPGSRAQRSVAVDSVTWLFNPETHYLMRNTEVLKFAQFETIQFSVKATPSTGGGATGGGEFQNSITIEGTYVPEEMLGTPDRITDTDRVKWSATIGLPTLTQQEAYGFYLQNPFDSPSF